MPYRPLREARREELPEYAALRATPSRALPPALVEYEAGDAFAAKRDTIRRDLEAEATEEGVRFVSFMRAGAEGALEGLLSVALPGDGRPCLLLFSSPVRAADYRQALGTLDPSLQYLVSTPSSLVRMLRDVREAGITRFALDRCPRCDLVAAVACAAVTSPADAIRLWCSHTATERARLDLYVMYAYQAAFRRRFEVARDVALETVGHVSAEDPRPHLLLGQVAIALGDRRLLGEATTFLRFLECKEWAQQLDELARAGRSGLEEAQGS